MIYKIDRSTVTGHLSDVQNEILNLVFSLEEHDCLSPWDGQTGNSEEDESGASAYPLRFILHEDDFNSLNQETENAAQRKIDAVCYDRNLNRAVSIQLYRSSFSEKSNFILKNGTIEFAATAKMHDMLEVAGILSCLPQVTCGQALAPKVENNFNDLPYSARRYYIENIILSKKPTNGFFFLDEHGCLGEIMPEVAAGKNLSQNKFHKYDIFEHLVRSCEAMEIPDLVLRFSALLHDIGKVPTRKLKENGEATFYNHEMVSAYMLVPIMKRFGIPKPIGMKIKYYVRNHMFHYTDEWSDKAVRRFLRKVSRADLANLILLRKSDRIGSGKTNPFPKKLQSLIDHIDDVIMRDMELKVTDLEINGLDLMNLGLGQGPLMGKVLNQLLNEVKNEVTRNNHEELIERAKAVISAAGAAVVNVSGAAGDISK